MQCQHSLQRSTFVQTIVDLHAGEKNPHESHMHQALTIHALDRLQTIRQESQHVPRLLARIEVLRYSLVT